ncbi:hypothetical protein LTR08_007575 [Meristemomyces frigidus]|nr:hypothetical protein LTR08_007575 [Meristemomyces frigidus]
MGSLKESMLQGIQSVRDTHASAAEVHGKNWLANNREANREFANLTDQFKGQQLRVSSSEGLNDPSEILRIRTEVDRILLSMERILVTERERLESIGLLVESPKTSETMTGLRRRQIRE